MKTLLPFLVLAAALASAQTAEAKQEKQPLPQLTADQILEKYIEAIGGRERIAHVKTIIARGNAQKGKDAWTFVKYRKAPDKFSFLDQDLKGPMTGEGCDGQTLWWLPPRAVRRRNVPVGPSNTLSEAPIAREFLIRPYTKSKFLGNKRVEGKLTYVVELQEGEASTWRFYFDQQSFLPLRLDVRYRPAMGIEDYPWELFGPSPYLERRPRSATTYFSEWREVDGIRIPFETKRGDIVRRLVDYKVDSYIDDGLFAPQPESEKSPVFHLTQRRFEPRSGN